MIFLLNVYKRMLQVKKWMKKEMAKHHAVVSALPYFLNKNIAQLAHDLGIHYFDLTEDIPTT